MDPYVKIKLGSKIYETPTDYNGGKNPKWRKTINCFLPNNVDMFVLEIFDEKSFSSDEMIAFVKYPFPDSLFQGIFLDEWIPLSGKSGELKEGHINIQILFTVNKLLFINFKGIA
jgi:toll-interacting protein